MKISARSATAGVMAAAMLTAAFFIAFTPISYRRVAELSFAAAAFAYVIALSAAIVRGGVVDDRVRRKEESSWLSGFNGVDGEGAILVIALFAVILMAWVLLEVVFPIAYAVVLRGLRSGCALVDGGAHHVERRPHA